MDNNPPRTFEQIIIQAKPLINDRTSRFCRDPSEREDVRSIAHIALYEAYCSYNRRNPNFFSYARKVVDNRLLGYARKRKKQDKEICYGLVYNPTFILPHERLTDDDYEVLLNRIERLTYIEAVRSAVSSLPHPYQEVYQLHFEENLPIVELAERLGLNYGAAAMRIQRLKQKVKDKLLTMFTEEELLNA